MKHDKLSTRNFKIKKKTQDRHDKENNESANQNMREYFSSPIFETDDNPNTASASTSSETWSVRI